jgi:NTE family protein
VLDAAHARVFQALEELDIPVSAIAGTSIGAFVSALYAFRKSGQEIEQINCGKKDIFLDRPVCWL